MALAGNVMPRRILRPAPQPWTCPNCRETRMFKTSQGDRPRSVPLRVAAHWTRCPSCKKPRPKEA